MDTYWDIENQEYRPAASSLLWPKLSTNGHLVTTRPAPAEALFLAGFVLGAAMWLAWAKYWRWY